MMPEVRGEVVTVFRCGGGFYYEEREAAISAPGAPFPIFLSEPPVRLHMSYEEHANGVIERARIRTLRPDAEAEYERRDGPHGHGLYLIKNKK